MFQRTEHLYITVLADTLRRAFTIAKSGRPGPVLVDITKDVTAATYEYEPKTPEKIERLLRELQKKAWITSYP